MLTNHHRRLDETAARQRQREEEAEARRATRKVGEPAAAPAPARPGAEGERTAPRLNLAPRTGGAPSWRDRQAAKEAGAAAPAPAPEQPKEEPQPARRTGGYVPPALRAGASATPSAAPPSNAPRPAREPAQPPTRAPAPAPAASEEGKPQKWVPRFRQQQS